MARNEKTSRSIAILASKVPSREKRPTIAESKKLAASVLTQAPERTK